MKSVTRKNKMLLLFLFLGFISGWAQGMKVQKKQIQVSGLLVTGDSLKPVRDASVKIIKTDSLNYNYFFSVPTDTNGFFILMVKPGDIIGFKKNGYEDVQFQIPDTLKSNLNSVVQIINRKD